jgi:CubicO group peptidase (beta-lactamase class C family)
LLTFTFGFGAFFDMFVAPAPWPVVEAAADLHLETLGPPNPAAQPDPDTWIVRLGSLPLMAQPDERWMYSTGASVLGVLLARAAGLPLGEVLRTRIFEPLGMTSTAFSAADSSRLAAAYRPGPAGLELTDPADGAWSRPQPFQDGAAGLVSTVDDLLAFARMFGANGAPVLSAESVKAMTSDQLTAEQKARGGLSPDQFATEQWTFCQAVYADGSFGWDGGLGTTWLVDPGRDLIVIVLTQRQFDSPSLPSVHADIRAAAYAALG